MTEPLSSVVGKAYPLGWNNVDTDLILPGHYLKTVGREGLGSAAFEVLRSDPSNLFNDPYFSGAPILIAGENFGCGSSREHAVWALAEMGIRVIIASSFSDIFASNAFKNGLLTVALTGPEIDMVLGAARLGNLTVSLLEESVSLVDGTCLKFSIDPFRKACLLEGLDEISLTLKEAVAIGGFEARRGSESPWFDRALSAVTSKA